MNFRKVLIFISAVFLFASCDVMNQKDSFVQELKKTETAEIVVSNESESFDSNVKTGKVLINIGGTNARMIRPYDSLKLNDFTDWHVWFKGVSDFDYDLETLKESFELPVGNYNVLVTAVIKTEGKEGGYLILSSIQGKTQIEVVEDNDPVECVILMERTKTEEGVGSFEYKFRISKFNFYDFKSQYDYSDPSKEIDFTPINYIKASLNGLTVSDKYIFDSDRSDDIYVDIVSAYNVDNEFFDFTLHGINIKSGFYRLKIEFELSNNIYTDSNDEITEYYKKAYFTFPDSVVEISDNSYTVWDDTENEKIFYNELIDRNYQTIKNFSDLLRICSDTDERVLELPLLSTSINISELNKLINTKKIKVDVSLPQIYFNEDDSFFVDNPSLYSVTLNFSGYYILPNNLFKNCPNLKYVRFPTKIEDNGESKYPWLEIPENAFVDCKKITFQVPEECISLYEGIFKDRFGEGNFEIEPIESFLELIN